MLNHTTLSTVITTIPTLAALTMCVYTAVLYYAVLRSHIIVSRQRSIALSSGYRTGIARRNAQVAYDATAAISPIGEDLSCHLRWAQENRDAEYDSAWGINPRW